MCDLVNKVLGLESGGAHEEERGPTSGSKSSGFTTIGAAEQAAATLSDIAHGDGAMQSVVIDEKGVPPLLLLMRNGSALAQVEACRAVWHLCEEVDNQGAVVNCGVIADLVLLSRVGDAKAQELAAAVISDLAKGAIAEREREMNKTGALFVNMELRPAFELWRSQTVFPDRSGGGGDAGDGAGSDDAGEGGAPSAAEGGAAAAVDAKPKDRLSAIAEAGGIVPLVGLVTNGNPMSKERAASALWHLSVAPAN